MTSSSSSSSLFESPVAKGTKHRGRRQKKKRQGWIYIYTAAANTVARYIDTAFDGWYNFSTLVPIQKQTAAAMLLRIRQKKVCSSSRRTPSMWDTKNRWPNGSSLGRRRHLVSPPKSDHHRRKDGNNFLYTASQELGSIGGGGGGGGGSRFLKDQWLVSQSAAPSTDRSREEEKRGDRGSRGISSSSSVFFHLWEAEKEEKERRPPQK